MQITFNVKEIAGGGLFRCTATVLDDINRRAYTESMLFYYEEGDDAAAPAVPSRIHKTLTEYMAFKYRLDLSYENPTPDTPELLAYDLVDQED